MPAVVCRSGRSCCRAPALTRIPIHSKSGPATHSPCRPRRAIRQAARISAHRHAITPFRPFRPEIRSFVMQLPSRPMAYSSCFPNLNMRLQLSHGCPIGFGELARGDPLLSHTDHKRASHERIRSFDRASSTRRFVRSSARRAQLSRRSQVSHSARKSERSALSHRRARAQLNSRAVGAARDVAAQWQRRVPRRFTALCAWAHYGVARPGKPRRNERLELANERIFRSNVRNHSARIRAKSALQRFSMHNLLPACSLVQRKRIYSK